MFSARLPAVSFFFFPFSVNVSTNREISVVNVFIWLNYCLVVFSAIVSLLTHSLPYTHTHTHTHYIYICYLSSKLYMIDVSVLRVVRTVLMWVLYQLKDGC